MTPDDDSVSAWLIRLPDGDSEAQEKIWDRYSEIVRRMAKRFLSGVQLRESDDEDIAVQVLNNLYMQMQNGDFGSVKNRRQLWALLLGMTRNKAAEAARGKLAQKRGSGKVHGESGFVFDNANGRGIEQFAANEDNPQSDFFQAEHFQELMDCIGKPELQRVVLLRLAGYSNEDIAEMLGITLRSVERKFLRVRQILRPQLDEKLGAVLED